jgi:hypothetical protein
VAIFVRRCLVASGDVCVRTVFTASDEMLLDELYRVARLTASEQIASNTTSAHHRVWR